MQNEAARYDKHMSIEALLKVVFKGKHLVARVSLVRMYLSGASTSNVYTLENDKRGMKVSGKTFVLWVKYSKTPKEYLDFI